MLLRNQKTRKACIMVRRQLTTFWNFCHGSAKCCLKQPEALASTRQSVWETALNTGKALKLTWTFPCTYLEESPFAFLKNKKQNKVETKMRRRQAAARHPTRCLLQASSMRLVRLWREAAVLRSSRTGRVPAQADDN